MVLLLYNYLNIISVVFVFILIILLILSFIKIPNNNNIIKSDIKDALISDFKPLATLSIIPNYWPPNDLLPESSNLNNLSKLEIIKNDELYNLLNINNNDDYNLYFSSDTIKNNFIRDIKNFEFKYYYGNVNNNNYFIPDNYAFIDNTNNVAPENSVFTTAITNNVIKPLNFDDLNGKPGENGNDGLYGEPGEDGKDGKDGENGTQGVAYTSATIDANDLKLVNTNGEEFVAYVKGGQGDSGTTYTTASKSNNGNLILSGNPKGTGSTTINNNNEQIKSVDKKNNKLQFIKNNGEKIGMTDKDELPFGDKGPPGTIPNFANIDSSGNLLFYNSLSDNSSITAGNNKGDSYTNAIIDSSYNLKIGKTNQINSPATPFTNLGNIRGNQGESGTYPAELEIAADNELQFYNNKDREIGYKFDNSGEPGNSYSGAHIYNNKLVITGTDPFRNNFSTELQNNIKGPTGDSGIYPKFLNTTDNAQGNKVLQFLNENSLNLGQQINKNSIDGIDGINGISYSNAKINSDYELELVKTNANGSTEDIKTNQIRGNKGLTGVSGKYTETGSLTNGRLTLGDTTFSSTNLDGTTNIFEPYYSDQKLYIKKNRTKDTDYVNYVDYPMGFPDGQMTSYEQYRPVIILRDSSNNEITDYNRQFLIDTTSKLLSPITSTDLPNIEIRINNNEYSLSQLSQLSQFNAEIEIIKTRGSGESTKLTISEYNNNLKITKPGNYIIAYYLKINNIIKATRNYTIKYGTPLTNDKIKELLVTGIYSDSTKFQNLLLNGDNTYGFINQWNTSEVTNMAFLFSEKQFPYNFGRLNIDTTEQHNIMMGNFRPFFSGYNSTFTGISNRRYTYLRAIFNHVRIFINDSINQNTLFSLYFQNNDTYTRFLAYLDKQYQASNNMYVEFKYYYDSNNNRIYIPADFELNGNIGDLDTSNVKTMFGILNNSHNIFGEWNKWNTANVIDFSYAFRLFRGAYKYINVILDYSSTKYMFGITQSSDKNLTLQFNSAVTLYQPRSMNPTTGSVTNSIFYVGNQITSVTSSAFTLINFNAIFRKSNQLTTSNTWFLYRMQTSSMTAYSAPNGWINHDLSLKETYLNHSHLYDYYLNPET